MKANNYADDKLVHEFGIGVDTPLTTIEARVLKAPMVPPLTMLCLMHSLDLQFYVSLLSVSLLVLQLMYHESGKESRVDPRVGQWNMIDKVFQ